MSDTNAISVKIDKTTYSVPYLNREHINKLGKSVNIFASGPSIEELSFTSDLLASPAIFVNGSIHLTTQHSFDNVIGYVITDARFIEHQTILLTECYKGQPLFITLDVLNSIAKKLPEIIVNHHQSLNLIYPVDRPRSEQVNNSKRFRLPVFKSKKVSLSDFATNPNFVINTNNQPKPVGVSLDITHGFVEAGTVAYVAAQLAYSLGAKQIHLYGIDLLNSNQPRFYESKNNAAPCKLDKAIENRIVPSFELLGSVYKDNGVTVINHSPISKKLFLNI